MGIKIEIINIQTFALFLPYEQAVKSDKKGSPQNCGQPFLFYREIIQGIVSCYDTIKIIIKSKIPF